MFGQCSRARFNGASLLFGSWGNLNSTTVVMQGRDGHQAHLTPQDEAQYQVHSLTRCPSCRVALPQIFYIIKSLKKSEKVRKMSVENTERQPLLADPHNTTLRSKYISGFTKSQITVAFCLKFFLYLRTLILKFQNFLTKNGVFLTLPSQLSQLGCSLLKF